MDFSKQKPPINGYICVSCNYFVTVSSNHLDLKVNAGFTSKVNTCFNCGKILENGVWSNFLPIFKILKENAYLIQNLIATKPIGPDVKITSRFCPDCMLFINSNSEYEQIDNVGNKEEVHKRIVSEAAHQGLFTKYMVKGVSAFGLLGLVVSIILFSTELSKSNYSEKVINVFRGGISFMAAGMIFGALVGIIVFRIKMKYRR